MPSYCTGLRGILCFGRVDAESGKRPDLVENDGIAIHDSLNRIEVLRVEADGQGQPEPAEQQSPHESGAHG